MRMRQRLGDAGVSGPWRLSVGIGRAPEGEEAVVHPLVESSPINPPQSDRDRSATQTPSLIAASFRT